MIFYNFFLFVLEFRLFFKADLKVKVSCLSIGLAPSLIAAEILLILYVHPLIFLRFYLSFLKFSLIFMNMDIR